MSEVSSHSASDAIQRAAFESTFFILLADSIASLLRQALYFPIWRNVQAAIGGVDMTLSVLLVFMP